MIQRAGGAVLAVVCVVTGCSTAHQEPAATAAADTELRLAEDPQAVRDAARALMDADRIAALVTVDAAGQPRVRSVRAYLDPPDPSRPASGFTVWVMTRLTTRKVEQVRAHPKVTLYFNDDANDSYASIMGTAVVHTDPAHPRAKRHYEREDVRFFWPEFPTGFVMLEVRPDWLEFIGPGAVNDERTWRPQAVRFE